MNCMRFQKYVAAFADGELDVEKNLEALEHLNLCPVCVQRVADIQQLKAALKRIAGGDRAPAALRDRVSGALAAAEVDSPIEQASRTARENEPEPFPKAGWRVHPAVPLGMAAAVLLTVGAWRLWPLYEFKRGEMTVRAQTVADVRDQHTWCITHAGAKHHDPSLGDTLPVIASRLSTRLRMPVAAPDLSAFGFQLIGADRCGIRGRPGAHLLYGSTRQGAKFSLFTVNRVAELSTSGGPRVGEREYFLSIDDTARIIAWHEGQCTYIGCTFGEISEAQLVAMVGSVRLVDRTPADLEMARLAVAD